VSHIVQIKNTLGSNQYWVGKEIEPDGYHTIPEKHLLIWRNNAGLLDAISDGYALVGDGYQFFNTDRGLSYLLGESEDKEVETNSAFGTTSTEYVATDTLNTDILSKHKYKIQWSFEALSDSPSVIHLYRVMLDGTEELGSSGLDIIDSE